MKGLRDPRRWLAAAGLLLLGACTGYQPATWGKGGPVPMARAVPAGIDRGGGRYVVVPGDTVSEIAQRFRVPMRDIVRRNGLRPPYRIYAGQVLRIGPPRGGEMAVRPARREPPAAGADLARSRAGAEAVPPPLTGRGFLWPVRGKVVDGFGAKPGGRRNDGINIAAPAGTPVRAVENGVVVYAGSAVPAFGRMLIIRHAGGYLSTYAHNEALLVTVGDRVRRGQIVARVGATGEVRRAQLHFQLRRGREPVDPRKYLKVETEVARSR